MPGGFELSGFSEFAQKLSSLPASIQREADMEVYDAANEWALRAKQTAPVNHGTLRGGITSKHVGMMWADVLSNVNYSAYVEWGTGTRVSVPADQAAYALTFKGTRQIQGQRPHPFFFIHLPAISDLLAQRLNKNILQREH